MKKHIVLLSTLLYSCHSIGFCQSDKKDNKIIFQYIKEDLQKKIEYWKKKDSLIFEISNTEIKFDILSVSEDIIRQKHIDNFSYSDTGLKSKYKELINRIQDSLVKQNKHINNSCYLEEKLRKAVPNIEKNRNKIVIFFSIRCGDMIFVKVIPSFGIVKSDYDYEFYGEAHTYLFLVDKQNRINKVYKGEILYN